MAAQMNRSGFGRIVIGLLLFGISFGYVEAAVVVYLRTIYDPIREQISPTRSPGDLFPLIRLEQLQAAGPHHMHRLRTELGRELATLMLLGGAAVLAARNFREWMAAFVVSFGIWDICFYLFLRLLIDWPTSLLTWDILFLLPLPWVGPVISPTLIAAVMIITGSLVLWRERHDRPVDFTHRHWAALVAGGIVLVVSFCWDYRNIMAGGYPQPFNWPLYGAGLLLAIAAFTHAFLRKGARDHNPANG